MASTSSSEKMKVDENALDDLKRLLWGTDIKHDVFRRWTQGIIFSDDEPTALVQLEGGPCAVLAPLQGFLLRNTLFSENKKEDWTNISDQEQDMLLCESMEDVLELVRSTDMFTVLFCEPKSDNSSGSDEHNLTENDNEEGESSPKKRRLSYEQFHDGLWYHICDSREALHRLLSENITTFKKQYGVLLLLYSIVMTKGIDQIKNEVEDPSEPLIDGTHGHGSQSLINLLLTGKAISNVWDNDKDVSGLTLRGINHQSRIGFLTLLEHLRYCEEKQLVSPESPEGAARRMFNSFDTEGSGFITSSLLIDLLAALDLVAEPEYVKIMQDKLDPEQLGIITLNSFMDEFFPSFNSSNNVQTFQIFHYNGLKRSCLDQKVVYQEATAVIMDMPELQIITDSSAIKTCLMTKWPTIELKWKNNHIPSIN